ncbi:flagellar basal-body rod protein FlgF [Labrys wisconsinensis]|uniref:Flagellar basal-body rod protein FlgF n=1 Tax=Labrys wisconsinensis TaxID=425677 RepID=A0ABU0JAY5_9HYPH|nr:flagellar basal-body rod protein FlgF [Labrys wisconsinensis]MDQ0471431.1 flagellar basal-body rod protein FlgF [Labrys wisconsinensis]
MGNALLVVLSRQIALGRELDVVANNMANVNTHGFRRQAVQFGEYIMPVASTDAFQGADRRVSFVQDRSSYRDFAAGAMQQTGNPLDIAIQGDAFFAVQAPDGSERYTRNGAFQIDSTGRVVTGEGMPVLSDAGPIVLDTQDPTFTIARDGTISTKDGDRGHIRLVSFDAPQALHAEGSGLFRADPSQAAQPLTPATTNVVQGSVEGSNVKPVLEMSRLIEINRAYSSLSGIIQTNADLRKTAIERLADLSS